VKRGQALTREVMEDNSGFNDMFGSEIRSFGGAVTMITKKGKARGKAVQYGPRGFVPELR